MGANLRVLSTVGLMSACFPEEPEEWIVRNEVEGPSFEVRPDASTRTFSVRACMEDVEPFGETWWSIDVQGEARVQPEEGVMWYGLVVDGSSVDAAAGEPLRMELEDMEGMCGAPANVTIGRVDGLPGGVLTITWSIYGESYLTPDTALYSHPHLVFDVEG